MSWGLIIFWYGLACIVGTAGFCFMLYLNQRAYARKKLEYLKELMNEAQHAREMGMLSDEELSTLGMELINAVQDKDASIGDMRHYYEEKLRERT